jgi:hypothetical protein
MRRFIITIEGPSFEDVDNVELPGPPQPGEPIETRLGTPMPRLPRAGLLVSIKKAVGDARCRTPPTSIGQRSDLNAARISLAKSSGSSHAAKWPPLSASL